MSVRRWMCRGMWAVVALLVPMAVLAQASHLLFPDTRYAPVAAEHAPPGLDVPTLKDPPDAKHLVPAPAVAGTAGDRCFAQCQATFSTCQQQSHDWFDCTAHVGRLDCGTLSDPAKRNTCYAQVQDCHARGATDACQANQRQCLSACGN